LIALGVQLCVQHDSRLGIGTVAQIPSARADNFILVQIPALPPVFSWLSKVL